LTPSRDHFGRALNLLRERVRSGRSMGGEPLTVLELAHELGLSATPVREALSRLAGEGLIEDRRGRGYFILRLDVADLDDFYQMNLLYLTAALEASSRPLAPPRPQDWARDALAGLKADLDESQAQAAFVETLFEQIALQSFSRALIGAERRLADILAPVRRIEPVVVEAMDEELGRLAELFDRSDRPGLIAALRLYHERRRRLAPSIVNALNWKS
jgi:DNA-binding GntR family transcriptional regulator